MTVGLCSSRSDDCLLLAEKAGSLDKAQVADCKRVSALEPNKPAAERELTVSVAVEHSARFPNKINFLD